MYDQLTSVIIGRPMAVQPYTFYEEIDAWLGPWGQNGYPLAYGKFYAAAFNSDILKDSPAMQKQFELRFGTLLRDTTDSGSPTRKGQ